MLNIADLKPSMRLIRKYRLFGNDYEKEYVVVPIEKIFVVDENCEFKFAGIEITPFEDADYIPLIPKHLNLEEWSIKENI